MSETVIKTVIGDAAYKSEQEFLTVEDAYHDRNPLTEVKATVTDIRINSKRYSLKKPEELHKANTEAFGDYQKTPYEKSLDAAFEENKRHSEQVRKEYYEKRKNNPGSDTTDNNTNNS